MASTNYVPVVGLPVFVRLDGQLVDSGNQLLGISVNPAPPALSPTASLQIHDGALYAVFSDGGRVRLLTGD